MTGGAPEDLRTRLSAAIRDATDRGAPLSVVLDEKNVGTIAATVPALRDPIDQQDRFLMLVAERAPRFGDFTPAEDGACWAARLQLHGGEKSGGQRAADLLNLLITMGLLKLDHGRPDPSRMSLGLTLEGWKQVRELRRTTGRGDQAFVAMWFHADMAGVFVDGIKPALEECGYQAYRVDMANHNNKIDDEIVAQIRRSRIVVADATGARNSVYYEAGFAQALGLPVLWCCNESYSAFAAKLAPQMAAPPESERESWFKQVAFDTRQHPFIVWQDVEGLRRALVAKIQGLGLDLKQ